MIKLLIIADDFTGALDTGVQFSKKGIKTLVTTDRRLDMSALPGDVQVLSLDAETRHIPPDAAYKIVAELTRAAIRAEIECVYKKTDSTLRGNVGAELSAILDHCEQDRLVFVPAFPKNNRTTVGAVQYVDGVPLEQSSFAVDPLDPVGSSNVAEIIHEQTDTPVECVALSGQIGALRKACAQKTIFVFDAATDGDLANICGVLRQEAEPMFALAGCAGFAEYLPELLRLRTSVFSHSPIAGSTLLVTGSVNQTSLEQVRVAAGFGYDTVAVPPAQLLGRSAGDARDRERIARSVIRLLADGRRVILASATTREDLRHTAEYARVNDIRADEVAKRVTESVGEIVSKALSSGAVQNLIVFGGDTLLGVMAAIHCSQLVPMREITAGVVEAKPLCPELRFTVIAKAGGFGDADIISRIEDHLAAV